MPVAGRLQPRSAVRPATGAATAPATPTRANRAMPFCDRWKVPAKNSGAAAQNRLNAANRQAWYSARRCRTGASATPAGPWRPATRRSVGRALAAAAATPGAARPPAPPSPQPKGRTRRVTNKASVTKLATGRASMMPSISPLITFPTTRPRAASGTRCAAYGTRTCTTTDPSPTNMDARRNGAACVDRAAPVKARTARDSADKTRRRFSTKSPKGTMSNSPAP